MRLNHLHQRCMATEQSEEMMELLRELATLKDLDEEGATPMTSELRQQSQERLKRSAEIRSQIKQLAEKSR